MSKMYKRIKLYIIFNNSVTTRTTGDINVGENAVIGMGATVTKSVDAGITVAGNPARLFEKKQR